MPALQWFKSSYSANNGACVEVAFAAGRVAARDSKNPDGSILTFRPTAWQALVSRFPGR